MLKFLFVVTVTTVFIALGALSMAAASVTFEAESGALGTDFTNGVDGAVQFISISTDTVNSGNPGTNSRVATYTVTFPAAGIYNLYARVLVGPDGYADDSLFYGNGFGIKSPATDSDWIMINGLASGGYTSSSNIVTNNGSAGIQTWKWVNLSQFNPSGSGGEAPITFTVPAESLTQTFQIGARENGLEMDKFAFGMVGYAFTVSNLDNGTDGTPPPPPVCSINWDNTQQRIDGFGFSSAWCGQLSAAKNAALYGTLGMSLLRVRIDQNNNWSQEAANAAAAHAYGAKVLGCAWKAPAYMTYTNVTATLTNCYLLTNSYEAYALWLNQAANYHNLDYVSVLNEPDLTSGDPTYLNMTADQIRIFCASNAPSIGRPVAMADAVGFTDSVSNPTLNDSNAASNVSIVSGHLYGGGNYVHTNALAKGKVVWMTEHYLDGGATNFPVCLSFAKEINDTMKNQFSAYIAWWAQDGDTNINLANSSGTILKDGYTLGQFAKFIRPGFYRLGTTNAGNGAEITAYKDAGSSNYVIVALNLGSTVITQQFNFYGQFPAAAITPWITSATQSLAAQPPITNVVSAFTYTLQPSNIVTFVGVSSPLAPSNLVATAGNNQVALSWSAVTGADSYNVKRSTASGIGYVTLTNVTGTSFADSNVVVGTTYYYVVSAVNLSGESANSAEAGVTVVPTYSLLPLADAYVRDGGSASINFGSATNLAVKYDGNIGSGFNRYTYLKFNVQGMSNVQSATLTLMPNQVDGAATLAYEVWTNDNWSESTITWNNQPAGTGVLITNVTGFAVGAPMTVDITSAVASEAANDGVLSIRISEPGSSAIYVGFVSREHPTNNWRPTLEYRNFPNTAPVLQPIADQVINPGATLNLTNVATDNDLPAQTLTFTLLAAPTNAVLVALNPTNAIFIWRPFMAQAASTNVIQIRVTDSGTPALSATNSFLITVNPVMPPTLAIPMFDGAINLTATGMIGPDYSLFTSTNLMDWQLLFTTNPATMPVTFTDTNWAAAAKFYRLQLGP